jgi:hypothetical protein
MLKDRARAPMNHSVQLVVVVLFMVGVGWDLVEWSERCASIPKITGSNPSGGSELTLRSDLLLI